VDSSLSSSFPSRDAGRWRTATLVAGSVAAVELCLLIVAGVALLAKPLSHHARGGAVHRARPTHEVATAAPHPRRAAPARPHLSRRETSILVLKGNGVTGAAGKAAARATSRGYTVTRVGDATRMDYPASVVMYRPGFRGEATRLAHDLGVRVVGPLDGLRPRSLLGAQVALIVGHS
jgi:hypothetical protein